MTAEGSAHDPDSLLGVLRALSDETGQRAWLVGGAVRDRILARPPRPTLDYDLTVDGDTRALARALARRADGHAFALSEEFGAWRVTGRGDSWQVDLTPLVGETLAQDLGRRDLTINAIASELDGETLIDPCDGAADLAARSLRAVGEHSFSADPLRVLRLARFHAELGFKIQPRTESLARASAPMLADIAGERILQELRQLIVADRVLSGLEVLERIGATAVVLPELHALRGIQQSDYHHLDVYAHTLATLEHLVELERDPQPVFGAASGGLWDVLQEPLANELTRGEALRLGALLHDIAKPQTQGVRPDGRITFYAHDSAGAEQSAEILTRLRASERLIGYTAAVTRHHLRLGFLVHEQPLSKREVYRYLHACDPVEVDVTVLSVADRLATRGRNAERAVTEHLELARRILPAALQFRAAPPRVPIRGDDLARELGIAPGPRLGEILAELAEAVYAGEVASYQDAVAHARTQLEAR